MTDHPAEMLSAIRSKGRRMPLVTTNPETEAEEFYDRPSRPCPGCDETTREGEIITKIFAVWWHHACARKYLSGAGADEAWLVLGRQLADRPGHFKTSQTRAITEQLLRIALDRQEAQPDPDDAGDKPW